MSQYNLLLNRAHFKKKTSSVVKYSINVQFTENVEQIIWNHKYHACERKKVKTCDPMALFTTKSLFL